MDCVLVGKSEGWIGEYRKQINYLRLDDVRCTIGITLFLTTLKQVFKRVTSIVHRTSSNRK